MTWPLYWWGEEMSETYTKHEYDVVVIGAGGAGLRAAIEAARSGAKTAITVSYTHLTLPTKA